MLCPGRYAQRTLIVLDTVRAERMIGRVGSACKNL